MLSSIYGMFGSTGETQSKEASHIVDDDEDPIISDTDAPKNPTNKELSLSERGKKPVRAIKNVNKSQPTKKTRWDVTKSERDRMKKVKSLSKELRSSIESDSARMRGDRKRQREEKIEKEKASMKVENIKLSRAMKKLAPRHRHKLGVYAQHELNKMIEERARK
mmetsp:Transcript_6397/g.9669  ORF Transcript_6397/g.9669 Transcript_6397/m.9669 type:complete len:164 (-) Transcript_6397:12-503(-)